MYYYALKLYRMSYIILCVEFINPITKSINLINLSENLDIN